MNCNKRCCLIGTCIVSISDTNTFNDSFLCVTFLDSMESQSTTVILIIVTVIILPLCVILTTIIAVLVSRKYFIQRSQNTTISVSAPIDNDMTDVDMQENPSYRVVKQTHSYNSNTDYYYI